MQQPTQSPVILKICVECGLGKELCEYTKHSSTKDKKQKRCKACMKIYRRHLRYSAKETAAESVPEEKGPVALPRTFTRTDAYVPDATAVYRNNGNKHILSKGLQT